jgi:hypothetical protein
MTEWWDHPYNGGEMVEVAGFPRPMYSPDAAQYGHPHSVDGPDVEAYKITVSRAGRWPWQAFDRDYSDPFAHGRSGNVPETGVAGVQRQLGIDDTGWIGEKTFNGLRSIIIPEGLPHAGEMAMNAYAASLIDEAYALFGGSEPTAPPSGAGSGPLKRVAMPSPCYSSRGGNAVRLIVIHTAEGATTIESLGNWFANPGNQVSSHAGADDKQNTIGVYVERPNKAWTQGNANPVSVSLELCGFAAWTTSQWHTHQNMLDNCARWIAEEARAFGVPITKLSASQAQGTGRGVCQHRDLGSWGGGHSDCGNGFPMDEVLAQARTL